MTARAVRLVVRCSSVVAAAAVLLGPAAPARAETVRIQANQFCTISSAGYDGCGGAYLGGDPGPPVEYSRVLLGFDIAAHVPAGANVTSAGLWFVAPEPGHDWAGVFSSSSANSVTAPWTEDVTWTNRSSSAAWTTPGGDAGTALTLVSSFGDAAFDATAAVEEIVSGRAPNYGFLIRSSVTTTTMQIDTTSLNGMPELNITYELPNATSPQQWGTAPNAGTLHQGDVDGDGAEDAIVHEPGGTLRLALSRSEQYAGWTAAGSWPASRELAFADANGDGFEDAVGRDPSTQTIYVALSDGDSFGAAGSWGTWNSAYDLRFADLDGDLIADAVGRNSSGDVIVGESTGTAFYAGASWGTLATSYHLFFHDVTGDRIADAVLRHTSTGDLRVAVTADTDFEPSEAWGTSTPAHELVIADADGDGEEDVMTREPSTGRVHVRRSTGTAFASPTFWGYWRTDADFRGGDADGDSRADVIGWKASTRQIFVSLTTVAVPDGPPVSEFTPDPEVVYDDEDALSRSEEEAIPFPRIGFQEDHRLVEGRGLSENGTARALQQERYWDRLEQSGATFVRINVLWGTTENYQAPGQEDPDTKWAWQTLPAGTWKVDVAVNEALSRDLDVYLTLTGNAEGDCAADINPNGRSCNGRTPLGVDPAPLEYREFVKAVVEHFEGRVDTFSLWNEPNLQEWLTVGQAKDPRDRDKDIITAPRYRSLYITGRDGALEANPSARILMGELAGRYETGIMPDESRQKDDYSVTVTALDYLEEIVRPRDTCPQHTAYRDDNDDCWWPVTNGVALHPYQHVRSPWFTGDKLETSIGKLNSPAIDRSVKSNPTDAQIRYTGIEKTLDLLYKRNTGSGRHLRTPGNKRPNLYITEFGYLNRYVMTDKVKQGVDPKSNHWLTEATRTQRFIGIDAPGTQNDKQGVLDLSQKSSARYLVLYHLGEIPPTGYNTDGSALASSRAWDSGLVGIPPVTFDGQGVPTVGVAAVTGDREYGKPLPTTTPKPPKKHLQNPQPRSAYCAIRQWARAEGYPAASAAETGCPGSD